MTKICRDLKNRQDIRTLTRYNEKKEGQGEKDGRLKDK